MGSPEAVSYTHLRYLLEMGNGFAFVARQKHFQIGDSDFFADLILDVYKRQYNGSYHITEGLNGMVQT